MSSRAGFVGRSPELQTLRAHLSGDRSSGVLLVAGAAGVGKTTLVDHALRETAAAPVVRGYCLAEPTPPLWPWRAALRRAGVEIAAGPEVEPAAAASTRFSALTDMSESLIAAGPMVIVLEDLHWADAASLDLLQRVTTGTPGADFAVIGTTRSPAPEEVAVRLAALGRYGATTITLAPFTPQEVAQLVDPREAGDVFDRTGGLPLLVTAVRTPSGSSDLAAVVRALLAPLTPAQRAIIEADAVLGDDIDETLLATAAGTEGTVADALAAGWHGGLLTPTDDGRGYRFGHALIRDGITSRLEPALARRLNRSAAVALESSADADRAGRIAAHWRRAGTEPDTRIAAARWSRRAAALARSAHAYEDAVRLLADALADMSSMDDPGADRIDVLIELAHAEFLAGRYDNCLERCADAAEAAGAAGRGDLVARSALVLQGVTYPQAAQVVSRLCQQALGYPDLPADLCARLLAQVAVMEADSGRVAQAERSARESLTLAAASGDPHAEIEAARAREMTLVHADDAAERLRLGDLVADRAEALGQPLAALIGHEWRIQTAYLTGRLDLVESASAAVERIAVRSGLPLARWHRHRLIASRAGLTGRFAEGAEHSRLATAIARDSGDETAVAMHYAHGIRMAIIRGNPADLPPGYRDALAAAPSKPLVDVERAGVLALTGADREAREVYDRMRALMPFAAEHPAWAALVVQMTDLIEFFDDAGAAEIGYRQLLPFRPYPGALGTATVYFTGTVSRFLGVLAAVSGDTATAVELLREALPRNRALGARPDTALTCLSLARILHDGDRAHLAEAAQLTQEALNIATRLDMLGTVTAAGVLAARIAADRDDTDPLTAREREVAVLLGDALTNRQIAERLVLSERTVESHVRSILAKTQCANRTEFVALNRQ